MTMVQCTTQAKTTKKLAQIHTICCCCIGRQVWQSNSNKMTAIRFAGNIFRSLGRSLDS